MAELPTQPIDIPLLGGLQQHVTDELVPPGAFLVLENLEHDKAGRVRNRRGYGYLANPGRVVEAVATRGDELVAFADGATTSEPPCALAYDAVGDAWTRTADAWRVDYKRRPVARSARGALLGQRVVIGDRVVFVWVENLTTGALSYRVESTDGTIRKPNTRMVAAAPGGKFCLTATNGVAVVVYYPGAGASLHLATLHPVTFLETDATLLGVPYVAGAARQTFDAKAIPVAPGFVAIATCSAPTLTTQRVHLATVDVPVGNPVLFSGGATVGGNVSAVQIRFTTAGNVAGVAYRRKDAVAARDDVFVAQWAGFVSNGQFTAAPVYDKAVFGAADALEASPNLPRSFGCGLCQDGAAGAGWVVTTCNSFGTLAKRINAAGDVTGNDDFYIASSFPLAEPFLFGGRAFALLGAFVNDVNDNVSGVGASAVATAALVCLSPGIDAHDGPGAPDPLTRYVAAVGLVESVTGVYVDQLATANGVEGSRGMMVPSFNADGSVSFFATVAANGLGSDAALGVDEVTFSAAGTQFGSVDLGRTLVTSGGLTAQHDGRSWVEAGFVHGPHVVISSFSSTGGNLSDGNYLYAFVYEWQDDAGALHQSEPVLLGPISPNSGTSTQSISVTVKCLGLTQKAPVAIVVFRTQSNGTLFFRISPRTLDGTTFALESECGVSTKAFTDTLSDNALAQLGRGFLYTNGSERPNILAPPSLHVASHQNRLWAINAEDPSELWFTKLFAAGKPPSWARGNQLRLDKLPSPPTALAGNGQHLVAFSGESIHYLVGAGPDDTGQNGTFSEPFLVSTTCGCVDPRSIAVTHLGIFFLGAGGLMLLDTAMGLTRVGGAVEDALAGKVCRSAVVDEPERRIYWLFAKNEAGAGGDAVYVVFDYEGGAWYTWRVSPVDEQRDQTLWRGEHVVCDGRPALRGFGGVPAADPDGLYVAGRMRTPWFNLASIAGFQRLQWLHITGEQDDDCELVVTFYVDHDDQTAVQSERFNLGSGSTIQGLPRLRLSTDVKEQLASQHMIEITHEPVLSTSSDGPRYGVQLAGLTLVAGVLKGARKLPATNRK